MSTNTSTMTYWEKPDSRGRALGGLGVLIALGFILTVGLLMSSVAQPQTVRDGKEGASPLDVRSVTLKHDDESVYATIKMWSRTKLSMLTGGSKLWLTLQPGGRRYFVLELTKGTKGALATLTPCTADRCIETESVRIVGRRVDSRTFRMVAPRYTMGNLGDRLEWKGGSLFGSHVFDQAPDKGTKVHHL